MSADLPLDITLAGLARVSFYFGRRGQFEVGGLVVKELFDAMAGGGDWTEFELWMGTERESLGGRSPAACVARGFASTARVRHHMTASFAVEAGSRRRHLTRSRNAR